MDIKDYKIVYMGTPEISAKVLEKLIAEGFNIVGLISNEDKEVGRKRIIEPTPTKVVALAHNIPVYQPHRIRLDYEFLKEINPDLILTMAYGQIVPQGVLDIPKYGCLNLHGSLLPKLRGAAPIQRAIINGDTVTGITLMEMVDKMDAGRMYSKAEVEILPSDNYSTLCDKLSLAAANLAIDSLLPYFEGKLAGVAQNEEEVTFADKIKPENEHLDLSLDGESLVNYIRGLAMTPGAYLNLEGHKFKIYGATFEKKEHSNKIGEIVDTSKKLGIAVKDGIIYLTMVQPEGKKIMDVKSYLNGARDLLGKVFD